MITRCTRLFRIFNKYSFTQNTYSEENIDLDQIDYPSKQLDFSKLDDSFSYNGVPRKFLKAMKFNPSKDNIQYQTDLKIFAQALTERLDEPGIERIVSIISNIQSKMLLKKKLTYAEKISYNASIFRAFNSLNILDLIPLLLKVDLMDIKQNIFEDEVSRQQEEIEIRNKSKLLEQNFKDYQPQSKPLIIKLPNTQRKTKINNQLQDKQQFHYQVEKDLLNMVAAYQSDQQAVESIQEIPIISAKMKALQELEEYRANYKIKKMQKFGKFQDDKISIKQSFAKIINVHSQVDYYFQSQQLVQFDLIKKDEEFKKSNRVYCFGFPYNLDLFPDVKQNFEQLLNHQFGQIEIIKYFDYRDFKQIQDDFKKYQNLDSTQKMLYKLNQQRLKKYNRSYAIVDFKYYESKLQCLSTDLRVFGLKVNDYIIKLDDADYKCSLLINNIQWGSKVEEINSLLEEQLNIKFNCNQELQNVIANNFILLRCNNFDETMKIIEKINNHKFKTMNLKVQHYPGNLRSIMNQYYEVIDLLEYRNKFIKITQKQNKIRKQLSTEREEIDQSLANFEFPDLFNQDIYES